MKFEPKIHNRHSIRLQGYDYSQSGAYFVTMVTYGRECLFGQIVDHDMQLNPFGQIVKRAWFDLPDHYPHVALDAFCIMPNHVHAVITLNDDRRGGSIGKMPVPEKIISSNVPLPDETQTRPYNGIKCHPLSEIVRAFKSFSARRINVLRKSQGTPVWQRNYYEHIIRNDDDYQRIYSYIESNIYNWATDNENLIRPK
jgi:putative transposase